MRFLTQNTARSLLDRSEQQWREAFPRPRDSAPQRHALLSYARRQIEDLAYGRGWDVEYPRDVWRLRSLGINDGPVATLQFDRITQPWLKDLAKRWIRARLSRRDQLLTRLQRHRRLTRFAEFLPTSRARSPSATSTAGSWNATWPTCTRSCPVPGPHHAHRSAEHLPADDPPQRLGRRALSPTAMVFSEDFPKPPELLPRALAEHVMAQVEDPDNLARFNDPAGG